jgi:hypothetical protein
MILIMVSKQLLALAQLVLVLERTKLINTIKKETAMTRLGLEPLLEQVMSLTKDNPINLPLIVALKQSQASEQLVLERELMRLTSTDTKIPIPSLGLLKGEITP